MPFGWASLVAARSLTILRSQRAIRNSQTAEFDVHIDSVEAAVTFLAYILDLCNKAGSRGVGLPHAHTPTLARLSSHFAASFPPTARIR